MATRLEQVGDGAVARLQGVTDRAVIFVRTADRLFEDRRVRRHALDAVGVDQRLEVALGDEAAGEEVQPDRLAMVFECFDGIHGACSVRSVFWVSGSFRGQGRKVNIWLGMQPDGMGRSGTITPLAPVRSRKWLVLPALIFDRIRSNRLSEWRHQRAQARSREGGRHEPSFRAPGLPRAFVRPDRALARPRRKRPASACI